LTLVLKGAKKGEVGPHPRRCGSGLKGKEERPCQSSLLVIEPVSGVLVRPKKLVGLGGGEVMIIRGIEEQDLRAALEVANYTYQGNLYFKEGPQSITADSMSWRLRLSVKDPEGPGGRHWVLWSWWDRSWWNLKERYSRSACYHVHRDFLYALYERAPHARVVTSLAVYQGLRNFESSYRRVGKLNVGTFFEPVRFEACCDCAKKLPQIEEMVPESSLGEEYALKPDRGIYSGSSVRARGRW
jgi:hypothetical protein